MMIEVEVAVFLFGSPSPPILTALADFSAAFRPISFFVPHNNLAISSGF